MAERRAGLLEGAKEWARWRVTILEFAKGIGRQFEPGRELGKGANGNAAEARTPAIQSPCLSSPARFLESRGRALLRFAD